MKIIITGEDRASSIFIRDAILPPYYEIQFQTFDQLKKSLPHSSPPFLLILNFTGMTVIQLREISAAVRDIIDDSLPVIILIEKLESEETLRKLPFARQNIYEIPFSHSEFRVLMNKVLKEIAGSNFKILKKSMSGLEKLRADGLCEIVDRLLHTSRTVPDLSRALLDYICHEFDIPFILLFRYQDRQNYALYQYNSSLKLPKSVLLNLEQLHLKPEDLAAFQLLENLTPQNASSRYLEILLGLPVKALYIGMISIDKQLPLLVVAVHTVSAKFSRQSLRFLSDMRSLLKLFMWRELNPSPPDNAHIPVGSAQFFKGIVDQLNFGIIILSKDLEIKYANREVEGLFKLNSKTDGQLTLQELVGEQNFATITTSMRQENAAYERPEIEIVTPGGNRLRIGFTLSDYIDPVDQREGYILSLKDITYTKELQEEISRMDRLASLGVMASGIAHEIRNPLAGIKAIAQTFQEELTHNDPKNEYVQRIIKQVNRLDDLLKSLFSYAKPHKPNRQFYQLREIVHEVLALMKQKIHRQNIKVIQTYEKNLPSAFIDHSQIQQVIFNLLLNSIEAIEKAGEIRISATMVDPNHDHIKRKPFHKKISENPYIQLHISDTGVGIASENLKQIFNPFFTTKNYGTGLGLSIVYQLVQENNGIIYFESMPDKGTDCFLFLPAFESVNKSIKMN